LSLRNNWALVPDRNIAEATHLTELIQKYLDDTDEDGLILALDWEKAFDRCSWQQLALLSFSLKSPQFRT
jgi:hypothetical protein